MARSTQPLPWTRSTTSPATIITTIVTTLLATSLASLPIIPESKVVPQGCSFHPQERLVSCRSVNTTLLQDFLLHVFTSKTLTIITTSNDTTFITTTPPSSDNSTITTTTLPTPNNTIITTNTTTTTTPTYSDATNITFAATEGGNVDSNTEDSSTQRRVSSYNFLLSRPHAHTHIWRQDKYTHIISP